MSDLVPEAELIMNASGVTSGMTGDQIRKAIQRIRARAWDEGAENAWSQTGEGWNGEYAGDHGNHGGEVGFLQANGDMNPYRKEAQ